MAKCWRCGGGKTITRTTTGTQVLPCPTCGGSGECTSAPADGQHPGVTSLMAAKPPAEELSRIGSNVA
jgi:hypothetical protein